MCLFGTTGTLWLKLPLCRNRFYRRARPLSRDRLIWELGIFVSSFVVASVGSAMRDPQEILATANSLFDDERHDEAEPLYRELLGLDPSNAGFHRILGIIARRRGDMDSALGLFQRAAQLAPGDPLNPFETGITWIKLDRLHDALAAFLESARLDPSFQQAAVNLGAVLEQLERYDEALTWCQKALGLNPDCSIAHYNLGNVLREEGQIRQANECFGRAIALNPDSPKAHWNNAFCHLVNGDFRQGWREYEWRELAGEVTIDRYLQPRWDGCDLTGRTLLVHAEQGIGDEILFSSCYTDLMPLAGRVVLVCEPRLVNLFRRSFPQATVHGWHRRKDWSPAPLSESIDYQIPAGSLPMFLRPTRASFPDRKCYLTCDPVLQTAWRQRLAALGPGLKVGISWQAGGQPTERRKRTTSLEQWRRIFAAPGVRLVNLQYGERADELADAKSTLGVEIHNYGQADPLVDLDQYAALISSLDLVISVGNATVHMAGAVGTPAWCLLPMIPSWRWMSHTDRTVWYQSVRLFRQSRRGAWDPVFDQVARLLHQLVGADMPAPTPVRSGLVFNAEGEVEYRRSDAPPARQPPTAVTKAGDGAFSRVSGVHETFDRAVKLFDARDFSGAAELCREILDHTPRHPGALHLQGVIARLTGRPDMAVRSLQRALAITSDDPRLHCDLAAALKDVGQYDNAVLSYVKALELDPKFVDALVHLGNLMRKMGHNDQALKSYLAALEIDPHSANAYSAIGATQLDGGLVEQSILWFEKARAIDEQHLGTCFNMGRALQLAQRDHEALVYLERAAALAPTNPEIAASLRKVQVSLASQAGSRSPMVQPKFANSPVPVAPATQGPAPTTVENPGAPTHLAPAWARPATPHFASSAEMGLLSPGGPTAVGRA